jgi:hypothetical protein
MKKILIPLLFALSVRGYAQTTGIDVPKDSKVLWHVYGKGVQVYVCAPMAGDSSRFVWTLLEAKAALYSSNAYDLKVGEHFFNSEHHPVWKTVGGDQVVGNKLRQMDAPVAGAVPWLLLQVIVAPDSGPLRGTTFVQRINTSGGKAPAGGADGAHKGQRIEVEYTAEYVFYNGN